MKYKEILELENAPQRDNSMAIIIREGQWCRAYEWSAYLLHHMIDDKEERLKPTKKKCNLTGNGVVMVGFKDESAAKFIGQPISEEEISYIKSGDDFTSEEEKESLLNEWKDSLEYSQKKKEDIPYDIPRYTYKDLVNKILNFNVERKTLIEDVYFIADLKEICQYIGS